MPFGVTFGGGGDHKRTTLQIFTARGDSLVDGKAEKGMDETLSDRFGLSFPARPRQVAVYQLRTNGRKSVRINGIEVEGASPTDVHSDPDYYDKLRAVYSASRSRGKPWTNPANLSFANNQKLALAGSIGFMCLCLILWAMLKGPSEDEENQPSEQNQQDSGTEGSDSAGDGDGGSALRRTHPVDGAPLTMLEWRHPSDRYLVFHSTDA